ncbi:MAG: hypothetical protein H7A43_03135 [Verrucomicrobia bacterium]|nr:hypothetical protein [Verrucomicrobiota bacterium]
MTMPSALTQRAIKHWALRGMGLVLIGATTGLALHYRQVAIGLEQDLAELRQVREAPAIISPSPKAAGPAPVVSGETVNPAAGSNQWEALKEENRKLAETLRARDEQLAWLRQASTPALTNQLDRRDRGNWLEDLKQSDPERYEEIVQAREAARQRVEDAFARKAAHFLNRDLSGWSDEEIAAYNGMLSLLDQTWQLADRMRADDLPREERQDLRRALMGNLRELTPWLEQERDHEFYQIAVQIGYSEAAASLFVDYLNNLIDVTSMGSIWRGMRPGGGGLRGPARPEGPP